MHPFLPENKSIVLWSATRLRSNWYHRKCNRCWVHSWKYFRSVPGLRQVRLTKSRVPYRCGRTHARLADARHDRHAQIFRKQHECTDDEWNTRVPRWEAWENYFSFFVLFFFFFHSAKSLREYNIGGASLGNMQRRVRFYRLYIVVYFSVGGIRKRLKLLFIRNVKSVKVGNFFRETYKWCNA